MNNFSQPTVPIKVGIVGTGYAAKKRAEALIAEERTQLVAVTGSSSQRVEDFAQTFDLKTAADWQELVSLSELDLIFICTINQGCGAIAQGAILADKHVVVEYPLDLEFAIAQETVELAIAHKKLLHVEHMEIIGGLHQAVKQHLPQIGKVFHARYSTIRAQHSVAPSWKYHRQQFGFPLAAALSRIHRLTDLFGRVATVSCQNRYWDAESAEYFAACLCNAQLKFNNGVVAEVTYGKGNVFWQSHRLLEIYGEQGKIAFTGEKGTLTVEDNTNPIPVTPRRGLFAKDTDYYLNCLCDRQPLYIQPQASLNALRVANAAEESSRLQKTVRIDEIFGKDK